MPWDRRPFTTTSWTCERTCRKACKCPGRVPRRPPPTIDDFVAQPLALDDPRLRLRLRRPPPITTHNLPLHARQSPERAAGARLRARGCICACGRRAGHMRSAVKRGLGCAGGAVGCRAGDRGSSQRPSSTLYGSSTHRLQLVCASSAAHLRLVYASSAARLRTRLLQLASTSSTARLRVVRASFMLVYNSTRLWLVYTSFRARLRLVYGSFTVYASSTCALSTALVDALSSASSSRRPAHLCVVYGSSTCHLRVVCAASTARLRVVCASSTARLRLA